ncbi:MAG TPA: EthD family reductase [Symbiobacteriaceae bacterium]|nr:EthD family reductase [Symbiobacteriaceae bacterium]
MYKLVVLYRKPEIPLNEFEAQYAVHMGLINQVPGLIKTEVVRFEEAPWGQPDLFQMTEMSFASKKDLNAALHSAEMNEAGKQLRTFAKGLFTMYFANPTGGRE